MPQHESVRKWVFNNIQGQVLFDGVYLISNEAIEDTVIMFRDNHWIAEVV